MDTARADDYASNLQTQSAHAIRALPMSSCIVMQISWRGPNAKERCRLLGGAFCRKSRENNPEAVAEQLHMAVALREALYRIFTAHADGNPPATADLGLLNRVLAQAMPHLQLTAREDGFTWEWKDDVTDLGRMLWPVARSAADLLTSDDLARVARMRRRALHLAVYRPQQKSQPPLVRHAGLRQCRQGAPLSQPQAGGRLIGPYFNTGRSLSANCSEKRASGSSRSNCVMLAICSRR